MSTAGSERRQAHRLDHQRTKKGLKVPLLSLDLQSSYLLTASMEDLQGEGDGSETVTEAKFTR